MTKKTMQATTNWQEMQSDVDSNLKVEEESANDTMLNMGDSVGVISENSDECCTLQLPSELDLYHARLDQGVM